MALLPVLTPFAFAQSSGYTTSVLYDFCGEAYCAEGATPEAALIQASDGNFYGTTTSYNAAAGTPSSVFRLTPAGVLTVLASFPGGTQAPAGLIEGSDGNFYGTTASGGANNEGSVFRVTPQGSYQTLYSFCALSQCEDGLVPNTSLIQGTDGNFYGTTTEGGAEIYGGAFFQITPAGKLTVLHSFCATDCDDGTTPSALVQGTDGNFYGTSRSGGSQDGGIVFQLTPAGAVTVLHAFCAPSATNCSDEDTPTGALVQAADGAFYGTAAGNFADNSGGAGTVFRVTTAGAFSTLYHFCAKGGNCVDGATPGSALVLGSDGYLYGTTVGTVSGATGYSTVFRLSLTGTLQTLYDFCTTDTGCTTPQNPLAALVQGSDGALYGTTSQGGTYGNGTVFKLTASPALTAPLKLQFSASSAKAASALTITYSVANATSGTMKYCAAANNAGDPAWEGINTGLPASQNVSITAPTVNGTYTYTLTCGGTESNSATLKVTGGRVPASTTALAVTPSEVQVGQPATLSATVSGMNGTASGTVTFSVYGQTIGSAPLVNGVAALTASTNGVASGIYSINASYSGSSAYVGSSTSVNATLQGALTATSLSASPNPVTRPQNVTLTATVTRTAANAAGKPTGTVTFYSGSQAIGSASLNSSGIATLMAATSSLSAGQYAISATYNGDSEDASSASPVATVTVK